VTSEIRYCGRYAIDNGPPAEGTTLLSDQTHPRELASMVDRASVVRIDDPLSFPWTSFTPVPATPFVVDISACNDEDLAALAPVLQELTEYDSILAGPDHSAGRRLSRAIGVRTVAPEAHELADLRHNKLLDQRERETIARWADTHQVKVVEYGEIASPWVGPTWVHAEDRRSPAVAVRIERASITLNDRGFRAIATDMVAAVRGTKVIDVAGVRTGPGDSLARALVLIDQAASGRTDAP